MFGGTKSFSRDRVSGLGVIVDTWIGSESVRVDFGGCRRVLKVSEARRENDGEESVEREEDNLGR